MLIQKCYYVHLYLIQISSIAILYHAIITICMIEDCIWKKPEHFQINVPAACLDFKDHVFTTRWQQILG